MVPKQRKSGQFGGDRHRGNFRTANRRGGNVKPPSKSCLVLILAAASVPVVVVTAVGYII